MLGITLSVGVVVGTIAGYAGGLVDRAVLRLIDLSLSVPTLVIALAILGLRGNGLGNVILALSITGWTRFARIARARVAGSRRAPHVEALQTLGARPRRILGRHLVPVALGPALVYASIEVGTIVLSVATLSFLGVGIAPPTPEWGQMLVDARPFLGSALWLALPPGIAITGLVLASNLISERLAEPHGPVPARRQAIATPSASPAASSSPRSAEILYEVKALGVAFATGVGVRPVLDDVGYRLPRGHTLALVGESGSGKTLSALAPLGLAPGAARVSGSARFEGRELVGLGQRQLGEVRGRRVGVVFQDTFAALNPVRTIGAQVDEAVRNAGGRGRHHVRRCSVELLGLVGLPDPARLADDHPHRLSGGMRQRALIAIALAGEPDLLIADEPTTGLDVTVQAQLVSLLQHFRADLGMAMLFVSHDLAVVNELADSVSVMYGGRVVEHAPCHQILRHPDHPYTQGLIDALPRVGAAPGTRFRTMPGVAPHGAEAVGCAFAPRCAWAERRCGASRPPLEPVGAGANGTTRRSACWVHPNPAEPVPGAG